MKRTIYIQQIDNIIKLGAFTIQDKRLEKPCGDSQQQFPTENHKWDKVFFTSEALKKKKQKASSQSKGPHLDADKCQAEIPGESAGAVQWEFLMERFPGRVEDALHA